MPAIKSVLAQIPLFQGLSPQQLEAIEAVAKAEHWHKGETIIQEGDHGDAMYILIEGKVQVSRTVTLSLSRGGVGEGEKSFAHLSADEHPAFGEMALLENSLRGATVTAESDCTLLALANADFERLCQEDPHLGYLVIRNMATQLSGRLRRTNQDVLKLSTALSLALSRR
ncbi:MAG: cyclic nucleotide-binding domain-containing protein [Chloroflexi bacterium]|nr:cyclic nucleotide-binding domain-containing protein [Chloroflexota bacterium]